MLKRVGLLLLCLCLTALMSCGGRSPAPVVTRQQPPSEKITTHIVSSGETLFSIAWRYEKDVHQLAAVNGIPAPYTIFNGQRLTLDTSRPVPVISKPSSSRATTSSQQMATASKPSGKTSPPTKATSPVTRPVNNSKPVEKSSSQQQTSKPKPAPTVTSSGSWQWQWPVKGRVTRRYDAGRLFKGIDISSLPGAPVYPAAPGVVVYSGDGLRGYGNLIIVKHNDIFLSAYAHNRKLFAREGQQVKTTSKIAEVGGDPSNVRRFYFEIRKDGKPVDPLKYLP